MSTALGGSLAVASTPPLPQYSHHAVIIGSTILLVTIAVIATVTLLILWGADGGAAKRVLDRDSSPLFIGCLVTTVAALCSGPFLT